MFASLGRRALSAGALLLFVASPASGQKKGDPLAGLDASIEKVRESFHIAGLAVGIVRNDSLIYAKGFGEKEIGKGDRVTPTTVFAIGSNTKSFTATAAAMLVDDGKLRWDDKVTRWLPGFQLYDPYVTRELTMRDVLSHRSGLGRRGDALWYGTSYSRREILRRIRFLPPNAGFRTEMGYQNVMVMAAGEASGEAAGMSYDDLVRARIFKPLGMTSSSMSVTELGAQSDVSTPHDLSGGTPVAIPWRNIDNIAPAGSINSNIVDMSHYVRMQLAGGTFGGARLVSAANLDVTKTPHISMGGVGDSLTHFVAYGLGWVVQDYRGRRVAWHNGGIDGMLSEMWTVPEERLGVIVLTNSSPHVAGPTIVRDILDRFLIGKPAKDYLAESVTLMQRMSLGAAAQAKAAEAARLKDTRPSLPLDRYVGTYTDSLYGDVGIVKQGDALAFTWQSMTQPLTHWHLDQFRGKFVLGQDLQLNFRIDGAGKVAGVDVEGLGTFNRKRSSP